jgi:RNA polymerase primary sigma factor
MNTSIALEPPTTRTVTLASAGPAHRTIRPRESSGDDSSPRDRDADAFRLYLRDIGPLPLLTPAEELSLARRAQQGDATAREELVKGNLRLVVKIARDYENMGLPLLDLIAEGNIGLMKAVERFDPSRGAKLSVYSSFWIKQSMRRALGNHSRTVRVPIHVHGKLVGLDRAARSLQELLGRPPTEEELGREAGVPPTQLARLRRSSLSFSSLDAPLGDDPDSSLAETMADEQAGTPYEQLASETMRELVREFLPRLGEREAFVVRLRFGMGDEDELTLQDVAEKLNLTRERVRQIQEGALKKLYRWIMSRERCRTLS